MARRRFTLPYSAATINGCEVGCSTPPAGSSVTAMAAVVRAMRRALAEKNPETAAVALRESFAIIDRSARAGIIKKNTAARYKSKLHLRVNALASPQGHQ